MFCVSSLSSSAPTTSHLIAFLFFPPVSLPPRRDAFIVPSLSSPFSPDPVCLPTCPLSCQPLRALLSSSFSPPLPPHLFFFLSLLVPNSPGSRPLWRFLRLDSGGRRTLRSAPLRSASLSPYPRRPIEHTAPRTRLRTRVF